MAVIEKVTTVNMSQGKGLTDSIFCPEVRADEVEAIRGALDLTGVYKSRGYSVTYEDSDFTDDTMALPTAVNMTGKKDRIVTIKLKNANGQNIWLRKEMPVNIADTSDINTYAQSFVGANLSFGAVAEATFDIK